MIADLQRGVANALERHARRRARAAMRVIIWQRKRDTFEAAAAVTLLGDPVHRRARLLADSADYRMVAWMALGNGSAEGALEWRRAAASTLRSIMKKGG